VHVLIPFPAFPFDRKREKPRFRKKKEEVQATYWSTKMLAKRWQVSANRNHGLGAWALAISQNYALFIRGNAWQTSHSGSQPMVNVASQHLELLPLAGVGGYSNEPALSLCNDAIHELMAGAYPWKFNRVEMPLLVTMPNR
jgi:hypothetical protein